MELAERRTGRSFAEIKIHDPNLELSNERREGKFVVCQRSELRNIPLMERLWNVVRLPATLRRSS